MAASPLRFQGLPGEVRSGVDPLTLRPGRQDLIGTRLERQRALIHNGIQGWTPITVTPDGVIVDGNHAVRAAAEEGTTVTVKVVQFSAAPTANSVLDLPIV